MALGPLLMLCSHPIAAQGLHEFVGSCEASPWVQGPAHSWLKDPTGAKWNGPGSL